MGGGGVGGEIAGTNNIRLDKRVGEKNPFSSPTVNSTKRENR